MPEQFEEQIGTTDTDSQIGGKDVSFYWKASQIFIALLVILEIINALVNRLPYGTWIVIAIVAVLCTWWLLKRFKVRLIVALTTNAVVGICSGIIFAVFEIIWRHKWWYVLNLISWPVMFAAAGMVVAGIFYLVFQSILTKNRIKESKGGGIYGGTKI